MKWNLLGISAALAITLCAADGNKSKQAAAAKAPVRQQKPQASGSGMVVAKDPDGALRAPTAAESRALTNRVVTFGVASSSQTSQTIDRGPGAGLMLVLDPATTNVYSVVTKGPDGKLKMECVTGEKAANKAVQTRSIEIRQTKEEFSDK